MVSEYQVIQTSCSKALLANLEVRLASLEFVLSLHFKIEVNRCDGEVGSWPFGSLGFRPVSVGSLAMRSVGHPYLGCSQEIVVASDLSVDFVSSLLQERLNLHNFVVWSDVTAFVVKTHLLA